MLLAVVLWATAAGAQEAQPAAPTPDAAPAEPSPPEIIGISEVTSRASALDQRLKAIEADLASAEVETQAQEDLEEAAAAIRNQPWAGDVTVSDRVPLSVVVPDQDGAERNLVPVLATLGHPIVSIEPEQESLEQVFLEVTQ